MIRMFVFLIFLSFSSCYPTTDSITIDEISEFDNKYGRDLISLCDSIQAHSNLKTSYLFEFRSKSQKIYFSHIDSLGYGIGYFESDFAINQHQRKLLDKTLIHDIVFNRNSKFASMKSFLLKKGDKAVWVEILSPINRQGLQDTSFAFFQNGRCIYKVLNAW